MMRNLVSRLNLVLGLTIPFILAACDTTSPQVQERVIAVPSSRPYRYIKPHKDDAITEGTLKQIERHNITHWKVKEAEKKARQ